MIIKKNYQSNVTGELVKKTPSKGLKELSVPFGDLKTLKPNTFNKPDSYGLVTTEMHLGRP